MDILAKYYTGVHGDTIFVDVASAFARTRESNANNNSMVHGSIQSTRIPMVGA